MGQILVCVDFFLFHRVSEKFCDVPALSMKGDAWFIPHNNLRKWADIHQPGWEGSWITQQGVSLLLGVVKWLKMYPAEGILVGSLIFLKIKHNWNNFQFWELSLVSVTVEFGKANTRLQLRIRPSTEWNNQNALVPPAAFSIFTSGWESQLPGKRIQRRELIWNSAG